MKKIRRFAFVPYIVLCSIHFVAIVGHQNGVIAVTKPMLMALLLAFFLLAHIAYITLFAKLGRGTLSWFTVLYAVWFVGLIVILIPGLGSLTVPVIVYGLVLGSMATLATRVNGVTATGGALFLVSDTLLALDRFAPNITVIFSDELIMSTYMAGEGLLVFGIVRYLNRATPKS